MSQQFIGEIRLFPYNFAPKSWAYCSGQLLSIAQNTALFSLLGITYGGNGQTTFSLPDLRGRAIVGYGTGQFGTYTLGQQAGTENVTLNTAQMPMHTHQWMATSNAGEAATPLGNHFGAGRAAGLPVGLYGDFTLQVPLASSTLSSTGGNQPHNNMQPYTVLAYCIALTGIYPSRN